MVKEDGGIDTTSSRPREETTRVVEKNLNQQQEDLEINQ